MLGARTGASPTEVSGRNSVESPCARFSNPRTTTWRELGPDWRRMTPFFEEVFALELAALMSPENLPRARRGVSAKDMDTSSSPVGKRVEPHPYLETTKKLTKYCKFNPGKQSLQIVGKMCLVSEPETLRTRRSGGARLQLRDPQHGRGHRPIRTARASSTLGAGATRRHTPARWRSRDTPRSNRGARATAPAARGARASTSSGAFPVRLRGRAFSCLRPVALASRPYPY